MKGIFRRVRLGGLFFGLSCLIMNMNPLRAQWVQTNGPGSPVLSQAVLGTDLYAGTNTQRGTGGVYLSTIANPTVWTPINAGLTNRYVTALGVHNSVLFGGTYPSGPHYRYAGGTWDTVSMGNDTYVTAFATQDTMFFAGTFVRVCIVPAITGSLGLR